MSTPSRSRARLAALAFILGLAPTLASCQSVLQGLYDERARDECEQIVDPDTRRACLSDLAGEPR